ncbi:MAG: hypothetical protein WBA89_29710 [Microcoleus sp.]
MAKWPKMLKILGKTGDSLRDSFARGYKWRSIVPRHRHRRY